MSDMTINKYLDTWDDYKGYFFFSKAEDNILNKITEAANKRKGIWVYKKFNDQSLLLDNQPFKWLSSKELKISHKNIDKFLDSHICYKELYFFSVLFFLFIFIKINKKK